MLCRSGKPIPGVFAPLADDTAVVGQLRCGTEPRAAVDPRLIRQERAEVLERPGPQASRRRRSLEERRRV